MCVGRAGSFGVPYFVDFTHMQINRQFGDYLLLERIAMGGQSEVFLALRKGPHRFHRPLVLKALPQKYLDDPKFVELFYQEAFIATRFSHPHLISIHDAKEVDGEHVMIMDYVSGQTVADIAQRGARDERPLSILQSVQIIADACDGLHYAHAFSDVDGREYKIVHCDVSPQNLMVTYEGMTKVFDFGIARILGRPVDVDGVAGGKYAYMSPEQCMGLTVDARSDVFSLGVILYELTTGYRLFRRDTKPEVIQALTEGEIEAPSRLNDELPMFLERCILKALERDPMVRYQSAAQFRDDLLDFLSMHRSKPIREGLGEYVAELFETERSAIVQLLRAIVASEQEAGLRAAEEDIVEESDELSAPVEDEPEDELDDQPATSEVVVSDMLSQELERVQRRHVYLLVAFILVSISALVMGFSLYQSLGS
ncbi:MAG: serine/threonine protein kinase [Bradymonadaceae bacterium]